jgi:hypothetical protein
MAVQRPLSHHLRMASAKGIACDCYDIGVPLGCRWRGESLLGDVGTSAGVTRGRSRGR